MGIGRKKQKQTAGDNSTQNQIENQNNLSVSVNNFYGVPSTDVVSIAASIYDQMATHAMKEYTGEAIETATDRIKSFGYELFPRLNKVNGAMDMFKDPKFQFWLRDAQITAAKTDRRDDLGLLAELLLYHYLRGDDKKIDAGIHHAINKVDEIDSDALCALTVACAFQFYVPNKGSVMDGLKDLDNAYRKLLYLDLPEGENWLDHLDMLGALRLSSLGFVDSREYIISQMTGYVCVGIKIDSKELETAYSILDENHIAHSVLVENECLDGYRRLNIRSLGIVNPKYIDTVKRIQELYSNDSSLMNKAKYRFVELWDSHESLRIVRSWHSRIPTGFNVTYMGRVLAQTNAKRIDSSFPNIIK